MERAFILAALICVCGVLGLAEARWTVRPITTTTKTSTTPLPRRTTTRTKVKPPSTIINNLTGVPEADRTYHPAEVLHPRLIERYDQRYLDGHYEYRYVLSNGDTRYERAYWVKVGKKKALAKKGYYSYPLPNHKFLTVYYTADHNGYRMDSSTYSKTQPLLPRSIDVPDMDVVPSSITTERTTKKRSLTKVPETERGNDKPNQTVDLGVVSKAAPMDDTQTQTTTAVAAAAVMTQSKEQPKEMEVEAVETMEAMETVDGDKVQDSVVDIQAAVTQSTFAVVGAEEGEEAAGTTSQH